MKHILRLLILFFVFGIMVTCKKEEPGKPPVADFSTSQTNITEGEYIEFTDMSNNNPTNWLWNFGDSTISIAQNPIITYSYSGTYSVSLKVTNEFGDDIKIVNDFIFVAESEGKNAETSTFTDSRDGHVYKTVKIGDQWWMAENLAYDPPSPGAHVIEYNRDESFVPIYGRLYAWEEANLYCPDGWHLPSDEEWEQLAQYISDQKGPFKKTEDGNCWEQVGKQLKTTSGWNYNGNGTDNFGFSALPGDQYYIHRPALEKNSGYWWSSTSSDRDSPFRIVSYKWGRRLSYSHYFCRIERFSNDLFSVRCVKD